MSVGQFFAVGRAEWHQAVSRGLNPAMAYLVLARFSERDNRLTSASVNAIETHTNISRGRAQKALALLEGARIVRNLGSRATPRYDLAPSYRKGDRDLIWLPNSLVDGVAGVVAPIEQLRQAQDAMTLRLFVDLYGEQDLAEDGGVKRALLWHTFDREHISDRGAYSVWGWRLGKPWVSLSSPSMRCHCFEPTEEQKAQGWDAGREFWPRLDAILAAGLAHWIPVVMESDTAEAEPILALKRGTSEAIEERLWRAAYDASAALLVGNDGAALRVDHSELTYRVPLPHHLTKVALVGVLRLLHRPRTLRTSAWWASYRPNAEKWLARFEGLIAGKPATVFPKIAKVAG